MKPRLTIVAILSAHVGYGMHAARIIRYMEQNGIDISVRPINEVSLFGSVVPWDVRRHIVRREQQEEWELVLSPPTHLPTPGKKTVYFTMWESSLLPPDAVELLNKAEIVIVPSQWNAEGFRASGVIRPIHIIPLGIDHQIFYPCPFPGSPFTFGTGGWMKNGKNRKGLDEVVDSFRAAFPLTENVFPFNVDAHVRLKIKQMPDTDLITYGDPRIEVNREFLSEAEMAKWYASIHCFVSGSKGEGWGLMQHEAMACGRPLIAARYGGLREFFHGESFWYVRATQVDASDHCEGCGTWVQPDFGAMVWAMQEASTHHSEVLMTGTEAARCAHEFTWDRSNGLLLDALKDWGAIH